MSAESDALAERIRARRNSIVQTQRALDEGERLEQLQKAKGLSDPGSPLRSQSSSSSHTQQTSSKQTSTGAVPLSALLKKFQRASMQEHPEGESEGEDSGSEDKPEDDDEFLPASMTGKVPPPVANGGSVFQSTKRTSHSGRTVYSLLGGHKPAGSSDTNSAPQIGGRELHRESDSWRKFDLIEGPADTKKEGGLQHRRSFNSYGSETGSVAKQGSQKTPTQRSVLSRLEHRFSGRESVPRSSGERASPPFFEDSDSRSSMPMFSSGSLLTGRGSEDYRGSGKQAALTGAKSSVSGRRTSYSGGPSAAPPQRSSIGARPTGKGVASAMSSVLLDS